MLLYCNVREVTTTNEQQQQLDTSTQLIAVQCRHYNNAGAVAATARLHITLQLLNVTHARYFTARYVILVHDLVRDSCATSVDILALADRQTDKQTPVNIRSLAEVTKARQGVNFKY